MKHTQKIILNSLALGMWNRGARVVKNVGARVASKKKTWRQRLRNNKKTVEKQQAEK